MSAQSTKYVKGSKAIPIKKVFVNDPSELPSQYSSTPGGTLFSTTPGGTKIVYEKNYLMNLRNSPMSKTPPSYEIPDVLLKGKNTSSSKNGYKREEILNSRKQSDKQQRDVIEDQFHIDL